MKTTSTIIESIAWPPEKVNEVFYLLGRHSGLILSEERIDLPDFIVSEHDISSDSLGKWLAGLAALVKMEIEQVSTKFGEVPEILSHFGPGIILIDAENSPWFLVITRSSARKTRVLGIDGHQITISTDFVKELVQRNIREHYDPIVSGFSAKMPLDDKRKKRVTKSLIDELLFSIPLDNFWLFRHSPAAPFFQQLKNLRVTFMVVLFLLLNVTYYVTYLVSWWIIGRSALMGIFDSGYIMAWGLLLLTLVPLAVFRTYLQGKITILLSGQLKKRLLFGSLRMHPDDIRHEGSGFLLGKVLESETVENLALNGGFQTVMGGMEILFSIWVLSQGACPLLHPVSMVLWIGFSVFLAFFAFRKLNQWTDHRILMTNDLVEKMVGHRTRVVQENPALIHQGEDTQMSQYYALSKQRDSLITQFQAITIRGWTFLGLLLLSPAFIFDVQSSALIAVSIGGIMFGLQGFRKLAGSLDALMGAYISWTKIAPFFQAATTDYKPVSVDYLSLKKKLERREEQNLITAYDLLYRYRTKSVPVLNHTSFSMERGDKILLQGPSGGGKSTLVNVLIGIRELESGLLLLKGLDKQTLGPEGWRSAIVATPQFHENHVLTETFAFNLLMGKNWPPTPQEMQEATEICHELGLATLLQTMPAGLLQMVGDTGWQLSHGEKSRMYIARALLQGADIVVLDESFAALDPETLQTCFECVLRRAQSLIVVAHP